MAGETRQVLRRYTTVVAVGVWTSPPVHGELAIGMERCHQIHRRAHDDESAVQNFLMDNGEASTSSRHLE